MPSTLDGRLPAAALTPQPYSNPDHWLEVEAKGHNWGRMKTAVQDHIQKLNFFYENGVKPAEGEAPSPPMRLAAHRNPSPTFSTRSFRVAAVHRICLVEGALAVVLQRTGAIRGNQ